MNDAHNSWTIKTFENDGSATLRQGFSRDEAVNEIYRVMGGWPVTQKPAERTPAEPVVLRPAARREKVAA